MHILVIHSYLVHEILPGNDFPRNYVPDHPHPKWYKAKFTTCNRLPIVVPSHDSFTRIVKFSLKGALGGLFE